ncbi:hypothetical protein RND71_009990 [Anisodus tanguticus]|uniref:Uncharacterized protein n=1 Tax=Anisodus tanguticus TaxID=243964 RepID=A0AAE1SIE7_9SOLA|nr:hypothetical protein RND71_009990 [Anisodus tanguticus]
MLWLQTGVTMPSGRIQLQQCIWRLAKGKTTTTQIMKMVYTEYIHALQTERNTRVFEHNERDASSLAREIACICNVRASAKSRALLQQLSF